MTFPKDLEGILESTPDTLSGAVRFAGTRVMVQSLLDMLHNGRTVAEFLGGFPNVTRGQAEAVVKWEQNQARKAFGLQSVS